MCREWVEQKSLRFDERCIAAAASAAQVQKDEVYSSSFIMTATKQRACIDYLRSRGVIDQSALLFWATRVNLAILYAMVSCNSMDLELVLSTTLIGNAFSPVVAQFNHDCVPCAVLERIPPGFSITAARDISPGEEICISYVNEAIGLTSLGKGAILSGPLNPWRPRFPKGPRVDGSVDEGVETTLSVEVGCLPGTGLNRHREFKPARSAQGGSRGPRPLPDSKPNAAQRNAHWVLAT